MALSNVSPGDPHAVAHNEERAAINDLETKSNLPTRPSDRAYFQILKALRSGTANIIAMGDSKTEGTALGSSTDRWLNKLQSHLRDLYGKTDTGYGYMPAKYATFYDFTDKPTITGTTSVPTSSNGLGIRSLKMELGSTVTFPARAFVSGSPLIVHWTRASGAGSIEVVTGSTVRATINTAGTAASMRTNVTIPAGTHSVILRPKAGTAAVTVEGVTHQTSTSGIKVIDGSISGGTFRRFGDTATSSGHWEAVSSYSPSGIILAFGANDMSDRTPAQLVSDATDAVERATITAPDAGIIILLGTERTETAGQNKVREYEAALRAQFVNQSNVTLLFESDLWLPKEGVDYTWGGPDGWLADTVHTSAFAHSEIARYLANELRPAVSGILEIPPTQWNDIQGKPGTYPPSTHAHTWGSVTGKPSTFAPSAHAASHASGGADAITPESIGAVPDDSPDVTDANAPMTSGMHRVVIPNITNAASFPSDLTGTVLYLTHWNGPGSSYATQTMTDQYGTNSWIRSKYGAAVWGAWKKFVTADDPRLLDTGWRDITPDPLPATMTEGRLLIRRIANTVHFRVRGAKWSEDGLPANGGNVLPSGLNIGPGFTDSPSGNRVMFNTGDTSVSNSDFMSVYMAGSFLYLRFLWVEGHNGKFPAHPATAGRHGGTSWVTDAGWPSNLPGTPA